MRRLMTIAALVLVSAVTAMPLGAAATTLRGEVVDVQCSLKDTKNKGADHADCALSCARRGGDDGPPHRGWRVHDHGRLHEGE